MIRYSIIILFVVIIVLLSFVLKFSIIIYFSFYLFSFIGAIIDRHRIMDFDRSNDNDADWIIEFIDHGG